MVTEESTPSVEKADPLEEGTRIGARFLLGKPVGSGGSATVYRAQDVTTGQTVALKVFRESMVSDAARFAREATLSARISHPNVCRVGEAGQWVPAPGAPPILYLEMEFVEGETLRRVLRRVGKLGGEETRELALQVCAGLQAAHEAGLIHRDLKPENLLIEGWGTPEMRVRLSDFGTARPLDTEATVLTQSDELLGTPVYMAPEQLRRETLGPPADLYALGAVLYEALTGKLPFAGETELAIALKRLRVEPTPIRAHSPDLDAALAQIVDSCLARVPQGRFQTAAQLAAALRGEIPPVPGPPEEPAGLRGMLRRAFRRG